jgi:glycosyltransferase involved in cell wall biosynthesis
MRILHIDTGREMRGGQWQVLRLMEGLRPEGIETRLAARPRSPLFAMARDRGLCVEPLAISTFSQPADLIHAHDARGHAMAAVLSRAALVVSRRVAFPIQTGPLSRWKYRRADHFIAVSRFVQQGLVERGVPESKISVVYDGAPLLPPAEGGIRVLAPPPSRDKPKDIFCLPGIEISFAENLEDDIKTAAIFVYVSYSEGLGSAVLLAMSAGVPVVAARVGGLPEIIHHEQNGLLVDARPDAVAAAVNRLRADPALAKRLAARGRETVAEMFSIEKMVRGTLAVYRRLLAC